VFQKCLKTLFAYLGGIVFWLALIRALQAFCIVNLPLSLDGLWTTQVNGHLVTSLTGAVAYKTNGLACGDKFIFLVRYYPNGVSGTHENRTLTSVVDTKSWHEKSSDSLSITYVDKRFRYVLSSTSDGVYMRVFDL
jgi:hypothetical protein